MGLILGLIAELLAAVLISWLFVGEVGIAMLMASIFVIGPALLLQLVILALAWSRLSVRRLMVMFIGTALGLLCGTTLLMIAAFLRKPDAQGGLTLLFGGIVFVPAVVGLGAGVVSLIPIVWRDAMKVAVACGRAASGPRE